MSSALSSGPINAFLRFARMGQGPLLSESSIQQALGDTAIKKRFEEYAKIESLEHVCVVVFR